MSILIVPPHAYVKSKETFFDKGVFAGKDYNAGDLIEVCPVVEFSLSDKARDFPKKLEKSVFKWKVLTESNTAAKYCLVQGFGGVYKGCQENFNMECRSDEEHGVLAFFALVDIKKDQELIMNSRWRVSASAITPHDVSIVISY